MTAFRVRKHGGVGYDNEGQKRGMFFGAWMSDLKRESEYIRTGTILPIFNLQKYGVRYKFRVLLKKKNSCTSLMIYTTINILNNRYLSGFGFVPSFKFFFQFFFVLYSRISIFMPVLFVMCRYSVVCFQFSASEVDSSGHACRTQRIRIR